MRRHLHDILLATNSPISRRIDNLIREAANIEQLHSVFTAALPAGLKDKIQFANFDNGRLTVTTESPVFATQTRMQQNEILQSLRTRDKFRYAYQLDIKVRPSNKPLAAETSSRNISENSAKLLSQEAEHCDDEEISAALNSLASHVI